MVQYTEPVEFEEFEEVEKVRGKSKKTSGIRAIPTRPGQVIGIGPTGCRVLLSEEALACKPKTGLAVGDFVDLDEQRNIRDIHPRRTTLSRPDPTNPHLERIIAANIDAVLMVVTIRSPDFRPGLIDRYLIAIEKGRAQPILCVNKIDLVPSPDEFSVLRPYQNLGLHIIHMSTKTGEGLAELRAALAGKLAVFVGHSGVGKSSLTNALKPEAKAITSHISQYYQKGRHITTGSTMYQLAEGLRLIDTPGVREFGLWQLSPSELAGYFHDFDAPSADCQFANCTHTHEPVCGVRDAVEEGKIAVQRYETYLRIRETIS
jgi:ribosome biogenesis GTPase / thiamine phosphate phosphatase